MLIVPRSELQPELTPINLIVEIHAKFLTHPLPSTLPEKASSVPMSWPSAPVEYDECLCSPHRSRKVLQFLGMSSSNCFYIEFRCRPLVTCLEPLCVSFCCCIVAGIAQRNRKLVPSIPAVRLISLLRYGRLIPGREMAPSHAAKALFSLFIHV